MAAGHGGRRPGAGRKKKDTHLRGIDGGLEKRGIKPPTSAATAEVEEFDAPDDLTHDERHVWLKLSPHAFKNRTLTRATAYAFEMMCRNIVLERRLSDGIGRGTADHRGMIQRIDAEMLRFNLAPCGKPMYEAEPEGKPENKVARFLTRAK